MKKKVLKDIIKICVFIIIANLPFITITQLIGMETFLDSFDNVQSYQYFKGNILDGDDLDGKYIVLQKTSHPEFSILTGDEIFYLKDEGGLMCRKVYSIGKQGSFNKYYTINFDGDINEEPVYENEVIGKVVSLVDNNIWNALSLKVWDASINNLNAAALFTNH
jgi:hypothetical protein